jgi:hypothetical protein
MLKPHGYATITDPGAKRLVEEHDQLGCPHCGVVLSVKPGGGPLQCMILRADGTHYFKDAGFCRSCMEPVCPRCDGKPCDNRHRRLDREEEAARPKLII